MSQRDLLCPEHLVAFHLHDDEVELCVTDELAHAGPFSVATDLLRGLPFLLQFLLILIQVPQIESNYQLVNLIFFHPF